MWKTHCACCHCQLSGTKSLAGYDMLFYKTHQNKFAFCPLSSYSSCRTWKPTQFQQLNDIAGKVTEMSSQTLEKRLLCWKPVRCFLLRVETIIRGWHMLNHEYPRFQTDLRCKWPSVNFLLMNIKDPNCIYNSHPALTLHSTAPSKGTKKWCRVMFLLCQGRARMLT